MEKYVRTGKVTDVRPKEKIGFITIWQLLYPILIYFGAQIIASIIGIIVIVAQNPNIIEDREKYMDTVYKNSMMISIVSFVILIPLFALFMYLDKQRMKKKGFVRELEKINPLKYLLVCVLACTALFAVNTFVNILMTFLPDSFIQSYDGAAEQIYSAPALVLVIGAGILGPISEELMFRGLIYNRIKRVSSVIPAAIITSVLFGVFHMNWVQGFYAGILSLLLIFVYEKYKSIIAPIILHMTANTISVLVTILSGELENAAEGTEKIDFNIGIVVFDIFLLAIMFVVIKLIDKVVKRKETYAEYKFVGYGYNGENFQIDNNYYGDINGGMNSIDSNEDRYKDLWESNINAGVNGTDKKEDGDYE